MSIDLQTIKINNLQINDVILPSDLFILTQDHHIANSELSTGQWGSKKLTVSSLISYINTSLNSKYLANNISLWNGVSLSSFTNINGIRFSGSNIAINKDAYGILSISINKATSLLDAGKIELSTDLLYHFNEFYNAFYIPDTVGLLNVECNDSDIRTVVMLPDATNIDEGSNLSIKKGTSAFGKTIFITSSNFFSDNIEEELIEGTLYKYYRIKENEDNGFIKFTVSNGKWIISSTNISSIDNYGWGNIADFDNGRYTLNKDEYEYISSFANDGHIPSSITVDQDLTVTGNLIINGTTTTVDSENIFINDAIIQIGDDSVTDLKDRGVVFNWNDNGTPKTGFFGWDKSDQKFKFSDNISNAGDIINFTNGVGTLDLSGTILSITASGAGFNVSNIAGLTTLTNTGVTSVNGTTNQINIDKTTGAVTFSLPQSIATTSAVVFSSVTASGGFIGNSSTASKLLTTRNIALNGDVSGNTNFDGSGNITITTAVADDSHQHTSSTLPNLTEDVQDIVGGMVSGNTENGIAVTYDDATGKLNFDVNDPVITINGDMSGTATITNLGNTTITNTLNTVNSNVGTYGSSTLIPAITVNAKGLITGVTTSSIPTIVEGEGIDVSSIVDNTITISAEDASDTNKGVASFSSSDFTVSSGDVTIKNVNLSTQTTGNYVAGITGTTNRITVTGSGSEGASVTLNLPQDIATTSEPTFAGATLGNIKVAITDDNEIDTLSGNLTIDSAGGTTIIDDNLIVSGNLTVNGTTTTTNSTTVTIDDPVFTLGGDTAPASDDNKDRGIEYRWHNGTTAKTGFFGLDDSTGKFTFIPDATNSSEVFSGTKGTIDANIEWSDVLNKPDPVVTVTLSGDVSGTANATLTDLGNGTIAVTTTIQPNSVTLGTDTTGNYVAGLTEGNAIVITGTAGEGWSPTISHADTSTQSSIDNTLGNVIQDLTLDTYGHITSIGSIDLDSRYYTESEIDTKISDISITSKLLTNLLAVSGSITASDTVLSAFNKLVYDKHVPVTLALDNNGLTLSGQVISLGTPSSITNTSLNEVSTNTHTHAVSGLTSNNLAANSNITNAQLLNSAITIGSTAISLGASSTTLAGLISVTATTFTGALSGNAATATKSTNIIGGNSTTLLGSIPYQSNTDITTLLAPNTTATRKFLRQTGTGSNGAAPAWDTVTSTDVGLSNVENTALSTWTGTTNITTIGDATASSLTVTGNLVVNGTTTTINSTTISVDDKNIELGAIASPTNTSADGGGITLKGATDKTFNWVNSTGSWTSSEHLELVAGKSLYLNGATSGRVTIVPTAAAGTPTLTLPTTSGTFALTSQIPTVNSGTLGVSIGTAGATNSTLAWGTSSGFNANTSSNFTYDLKVGPALTALAALMTGAGSGFLKKTAQDTFSLDSDGTYQPADATLTALAGLSTSADKYIYATGIDTFTTGTITSFARTLLDDADVTTARATLGLDSIVANDSNNVNLTGGTIDNITIGATTATTGRFTTVTSTVTTGTAPLVVASTTAVTNLNADLLDGNHASAFSISSHTHGNITNTGYLGSTASIPLITGTAGIIQAGSFGTTSGTFCQGNDSRLSDTRNTTNSITLNNSGTGAASGTTFNGSSAVTVSYNTIGASPLAGSTSIVTVGTIATGTWSATTIGTSKGGTGLTSFTSGGAVYATSTSTLTTGTLPVTAGGTGVTTSTGTGSVVLSTSPTLVTPALGTPTSGTLTNCTGLPNTGVTGLGTMSTQAANNVAVTGGTINNTAIGGTTPSTGAFTTLSATSHISTDRVLVAKGVNPASTDVLTSSITIGRHQANSVGWIQTYGLTSAESLQINPIGGRVIIGTTTDDGVNKLQVNGGGKFSGEVTSNLYGGSIASKLNVNSIDDPQIDLRRWDGGTNYGSGRIVVDAIGKMHFYASLESSNVESNNNLMTLSSTGLSVSGSIASTSFNDGVAASPNARNRFHQLNVGSWGITTGWIAAAFGDTTSNNVVIGQADGAAIIGAHSGALDAWAPLYINPAGNRVIIGTITDDGVNKLQVNGGISIKSHTCAKDTVLGVFDRFQSQYEAGQTITSSILNDGVYLVTTQAENSPTSSDHELAFVTVKGTGVGVVIIKDSGWINTAASGNYITVSNISGAFKVLYTTIIKIL